MILKTKYFNIFLISFAMNWLWENWHSQFYLSFEGGEISQWILTRAALADAGLILIIYFLACFLFKSKDYQAIFIFVLGVWLAVVIEKFALSINWWSYSESMIIIPWLNIGLTPTVQLGLLGWLAFLFLTRTRYAK